MFLSVKEYIFMQTNILYFPLLVDNGLWRLSSFPTCYSLSHYRYHCLLLAHYRGA